MKSLTRRAAAAIVLGCLALSASSSSSPASASDLVRSMPARVPRR